MRRLPVPGLTLAVLLSLGTDLGADTPAGLEEMRALAARLVEEGRYETAVGAYLAITQATPSDPEAHYQLAATMAFLRGYAGAAEALEKASALDPRDPRFPALQSLVYLELRRPEDAARAALAGARLGDVTAMFMLGGFYQRGHGVEPDAREAVRWIEAAAEGGHMGAMKMLARVFREGELDRPVDESRARQWRKRLAEAERTLDEN